MWRAEPINQSYGLVRLLLLVVCRQFFCVVVQEEGAEPYTVFAEAPPTASQSRLFKVSTGRPSRGM